MFSRVARRPACAKARMNVMSVFFHLFLQTNSVCIAAIKVLIRKCYAYLIKEIFSLQLRFSKIKRSRLGRLVTENARSAI